MSPVVLRVDKFRIMIYSDDHSPAHVHVQSAGNDVKIRLDPVTVVKNGGFGPKDVSRAMRIVEEHQDYLLTEWRNHFGND